MNSVASVDMSDAQIATLRAAFDRRGWAWLEADHRPLLFALRGPASPPDRYTDAAGYVVRLPATATAPARVVGRLFRASTRPGLRALRERRNPAGVFQLLADHVHRGLWRAGEHHGRPALVHAPGAIALGRRDGNRNDVHDPAPAVVEGRAINGHDPGADRPIYVGNSSEGCVVFWLMAFVLELRRLLARQAEHGHGDRFDLHLLDCAGSGALDELRRAVGA